MQQLIISVPNQAAADEVRRAVSAIIGVKISLVVPEGAAKNVARKSRSRIATEDLAQTLIEGVQEIREIEAGRKQSVTFEAFMCQLDDD